MVLHEQSDLENQLCARIENLEIRITHQDAAIDELTRTQLKLEKIIVLQAEKIKQLDVELKTMAPASPTGSADEIPPHY